MAIYMAICFCLDFAGNQLHHDSSVSSVSATVVRTYPTRYLYIAWLTYASGTLLVSSLKTIRGVYTYGCCFILESRSEWKPPRNLICSVDWLENVRPGELVYTSRLTRLAGTTGR